jgi:hypothetical protein
MGGTTAIFRREVSDRRDLLLVALAAAAIAWLMPLLPGLQSYDPVDVRDVSSSTLALALGWGIAIGLGATVFGSDLSAGRFGFYFARPVRGLAVWCGRSAAALMLVLAAETLIVLPSLLIHGNDGLNLGVDGGWLLAIAFFGVPVMLFLAAHTASIMLRARTAWLFLDLIGIVAAGFVAWETLRPFLWIGAEIALWVIGGALFIALLLALAIAGTVGTVTGRCDLRRTHGALSLTLWSVLAVTMGAVAAYGGWLRGFEPRDVDRVEVLSVSPTGEWVEVFGWAPGRLDVRRRFLISTSDGRWLVNPDQRSWHMRDQGLWFFRRRVWGWNPMMFSTDGSRAAWLGAGRGGEPRALRYVALDGVEMEAVSTKMLLEPGTTFELSPDGAQVAVMEEGTLSIYELAGERLLTAVRLPENLRGSTMFFLDVDMIRLYGRSPEREGRLIRIAEVRVPSGEILRTGEVAGPPDYFWTAFDSGVETMVIGWRAEGPDHGVRDMRNARNGEFICSLTGGVPRLLSNFRTATLREEDDGRAWLIVESLDGANHVEYDLGIGVEAKLCGEALPGELMVLRLVDPAVRSEGRRADLIDLETGSWRSVATGVRRSWIGFQWKSGALGSTFWYVNRPAANRLLTDRTGALVRWDPDTGELIHISGGRD